MKCQYCYNVSFYKALIEYGVTICIAALNFGLYMYCLLRITLVPLM